MTEWKILKIEQTSDYESINSAFAKRAEIIAPERNSSEYRRLYVTYKEALRYAAREHAVMEGRRAEDLDFDFRDDRYLDEFMRILGNICNSGLKQSQTVWKSLVDDSDYRTLQRTDTFIETFDRYMSGVQGLNADVWKYLINHFKVYGFSAQNKKLIANLQKYGNIKEDVFIKNDMPAMPKTASGAGKNSRPQGTDRKSRQNTDIGSQRNADTGFQQNADIRSMRNTDSRPQADRDGQPQHIQEIRQTAGSQQSTADSFLEKYMSFQDDRIVDELSTDFFKRFGRVYSHEITKNNMSAWRYLMQDEKYTYLLKQAKFTEKIANSLRYVNDLYPVVWEYIIDKTRVPKEHSMYQKTTGELNRLMKNNRYTGEIMPQGVIQPEFLKSIIDEDNFAKGHHDYPQGTQTQSADASSNRAGTTLQQKYNVSPNTYKNKNKGSQKFLIIVLVIIAIILQMLGLFAY